MHPQADTQLEAEEFFVGEGFQGEVFFLLRGGKVDARKSPGLGHEAVPFDEIRRKFIFHMAAAGSKGRVHEPAQRALGKPFREGIEGNEAFQGCIALVQHFNVERCRLDFSVAEAEFPVDDCLGAHRQGFFEEGAVEAGKDGFGSIILDTQLQSAHATEAKPLVGDDRGHRVHASSLRELRKGNESGTVFVVAGIIREKVGDRGDAQARQARLDPGAGAPQASCRLAQFMHEHAKEYSLWTTQLYTRVCRDSILWTSWKN